MIEEQLNNIERELKEIKEILKPKVNDKQMTGEEWEKLMDF